MQANRALARLAANTGGFFWLPCPSCGQEFGGHEWTDVDGHESGIPSEVRRDGNGEITSVTSTGICPTCTAKGVGCLAHDEAGTRSHVDCEFLPQLFKES